MASSACRRCGCPARRELGAFGQLISGLHAAGLRRLRSWCPLLLAVLPPHAPRPLHPRRRREAGGGRGAGHLDHARPLHRLAAVRPARRSRRRAPLARLHHDVHREHVVGPRLHGGRDPDLLQRRSAARCWPAACCSASPTRSRCGCRPSASRPIWCWRCPTWSRLTALFALSYRVAAADHPRDGAIHEEAAAGRSACRRSSAANVRERMERIILDVDSAGDDILAVLFAAASPTLQARGRDGGHRRGRSDRAGHQCRAQHAEPRRARRRSGRRRRLAADRRQCQGGHGGAGPFRETPDRPLRRAAQGVQSEGAANRAGRPIGAMRSTS